MGLQRTVDRHYATAKATIATVTSAQQSREFVIATHLEAVNYGKNVGSVRPDLIRWGRERDRGLHSSKPESGPRFLAKE